MTREDKMDSERMSVLADALSRGRISRRDFLKVATGLGLSLPAAMTLLQGCAPAEEAEPTTPPAGETPAAADTPVPTMAPTTPPAPAKTSAIIGLGGPANSIDPFFWSSVYDLTHMVSIFDSLFDLDLKTTEIKPNLVEEWEQMDALTWAFKLKEGVQFHKGYGEVTADDYVWWVNKIVGEEGRIYFIMGSGMVADAVATDKYSFEVHLAQPWPAFAVTSLVTFGGFVLSSKAYEELGADEFARNPIGAGPFELEAWTPGGEVVMKKFEDYHNPDVVKLEELRFQGIEDQVVRLEKIRKGEIDWTFGLDMKDIPQLRDDPNVQVLEVPGWNWDVLQFNHTRTDKPWADKRVRQAISYAIDRNAIVDVVYYGGANPEDDHLPDGYLGADPDPEFYPDDGDPDKAKALLDEAGYGDGFTMPCLTSDKQNLRRELELVAEQLRQVGITVEIELADMATYNSRSNALEYDTYLEDHGAASPDSDSALYWWFHTDEVNLQSAGFSNAEIDDLLDRARSSLDSSERDQLYREAVELIADENPTTVLCNVNEQYVLQAGLSGFEANPQSFFSSFRTMGWTA
jgi:peptide/nickel transport system substrate-binding protein